MTTYPVSTDSLINNRRDIVKLAVFDFDGTLFPQDTLPFLLRQWHTQGRSFKKLIKAYASVGVLYVRYKMGARGLSREMMRRTALQRVTRIFEGMSEAEVSEFFRQNAELIVPLLRESVLDELKKAKSAGYHTVLLSGGYQTLMEHVGEMIGVDAVIATAIYYKGGMADTHRELDIVCGDGKADSLVAAFEGREVDWQGSIAYADSYSDLPILRMVGHPVAVYPDRDLADMLPELGWRVMEG